jgi:hypothetical protein
VRFSSLGYRRRVTLGDELIERIGRSSLADLVGVTFLAPFAGELGGDATRVSDALVAAIASKNQFAAFEPRLVTGIASEMEALFHALSLVQGSERAPVFARHAATLGALLREVLGAEPREVTNASYSPELQLEVLGVALDTMREPVLDVGCGAEALLVRFLRTAGKVAHGVDALASGGELATRADWLAFDYGTARFGTIVSHLAFTLHFMHQEMKRSDLAFEYARAYMRIVRALAKGGAFAYIPGVPFIESLLAPREFQVLRVALAPGLATDEVKRVQEATGLVLDAATHVVRR